MRKRTKRERRETASLFMRFKRIEQRIEGHTKRIEIAF